MPHLRAKITKHSSASYVGMVVVLQLHAHTLEFHFQLTLKAQAWFFFRIHVVVQSQCREVFEYAQTRTQFARGNTL